MPTRSQFRTVTWVCPCHHARDYLPNPQIFACDKRKQKFAHPGKDLAGCPGGAAIVCHRSGPLRGHAGIFDRAHHGALRGVEMPDAFGAFLRIDDVHVFLETDGGVGTFEFTSAAYRAL
jgi:hypothetical protein